MGEWLLSRRDRVIVARHEVPVVRMQRGPRPGTVEGMSKRQRVESSNVHAASEMLGTPVEKSASDDVRPVRPDFGCHEWFLSQDRFNPFNRPAGTRLFFS
jgi:hypothetical protein